MKLYKKCLSFLLVLCLALAFVPMALAEEDAPVTGKMGDANRDGAVTAADAAAILRFIVKLDPLIGQGLANADANGDAKITAADAAQILRFIVKLENKLGPK